MLLYEQQGSIHGYAMIKDGINNCEPDVVTLEYHILSPWKVNFYDIAAGMYDWNCCLILICIKFQYYMFFTWKQGPIS